MPTDFKFMQYPIADETSVRNLPYDKIISITISDNHEVFIQKRKIIYWDNIVNEVLEINRNWGLMQTLLPNVLIESDSRAQYSFVDRVKEEISRTGKSIFYYRVGNENVFYQSSPNHGTIRELVRDETIRTKNSILKEVFINYENNPINIEPNVYDVYKKKIDSFRYDLYNLNKENIQFFLSNSLFKSIRVFPDNKFIEGNKTMNEKEFYSLLQNYSSNGIMVFIYFDDNLKFSDYIAYLQILSKLNLNNLDYSPKKGAVIEISKSLEMKLSSLNINLNKNNIK